MEVSLWIWKSLQNLNLRSLPFLRPPGCPQRKNYLQEMIHQAATKTDTETGILDSSH